MGDLRQHLRGRFEASVTPTGRLWLAIGTASVSAVVLGGYMTLVALATLLAESCGNDLRWVALFAAAVLAALAAIVGLVVGGWSLHQGGRLRGQARWASGILAFTALAWTIAIVSPWLPDGTCA
ncbi:MAG TPA: hypothetical protein VGO78_10765 [Acidimicrobiales bacterium]|nr:hypothetical protein [Acidimicrobiales bacterium]